MAVATAPTRTVEHVIEATVRSQLGPIVDSVRTRFHDDQQGEAAIYVDVMLTESAPPVLGRRFTDTQLAVMAALEGEGEIRFPYLAAKWPADNYADEVEPPVRGLPS